MRYKEGFQRNQTVLFPETLDEYINEDNLIRFIDAYVEGLDIKELNFTYCEPKETGRKAYDPKIMLKLYIYGYLRDIRSSRRLEAESKRNVELMWLIQKLSPDFKTIADFRKDNTEAIKKVFKEFTLLCKRLGLFGSELVAIDGSKFKAVNSKDNCYTVNNLKKDIKEIDNLINEYIAEIKKTDKKESKLKKIKENELKEKIKKIKKERKELSKILEEVEQNPEKQKSLIDPDSRMMKFSGKQFDVGYNGQISVDTKHHMIVTAEITNEGNDLKQLNSITEKTKTILGKKEMKVVCDSGYFNEKEIVNNESSGTKCYIPAPKKGMKKADGTFGIEQFKYNKKKDVYECPNKKELTYRGTFKKEERIVRNYECSECNSCPIREKCTKSKGNRYILRSEYAGIINKVKKRTRLNKKILKKRSQTVEHVFGTLKSWMGYRGGFLLKGLEKVSCEFSLLAMSYNIKRSVNILGVRRLIEALKVA
jgi:transposase